MLRVKIYDYDYIQQNEFFCVDLSANIKSCVPDMLSDFFKILRGMHDALECINDVCCFLHLIFS